MNLLAYGIEVVIKALLFILPAYIANMTPLIVANVIRNRRPIDMGKYWIDGKRVLGDNKSVEGFASGVIAGIIVGVALGSPFRGFLMGLGAMAGDVLGSFVKRRLNIAQGESAPILDQYLFVLMALLFSSFAGYTATLEELAVILIVTPLLHLTGNYVAYLLKIKRKPF
ncbi:MAG: CDP-2,3-bis-(O-geranylgeranyl)-sn-glycerol synthase [Candidatus Nezhaarchaeales archaeon]